MQCPSPVLERVSGPVAAFHDEDVFGRKYGISIRVVELYDISTVFAW